MKKEFRKLIRSIIIEVLCTGILIWLIWVDIPYIIPITLTYLLLHIMLHSTLHDLIDFKTKLENYSNNLESLKKILKLSKKEYRKK